MCALNLSNCVLEKWDGIDHLILLNTEITSILEKDGYTGKKGLWCVNYRGFGVSWGALKPPSKKSFVLDILKTWLLKSSHFFKHFFYSNLFSMSIILYYVGYNVMVWNSSMISIQLYIKYKITFVWPDKAWHWNYE